ncbi:MAG: MotA/TolQ/ExbB proton channel family protein [Phycisphaeraceae bacterium]
MLRTRSLIPAAAVLLLTASPLMAQAQDTGTRTWFQMFFVGGDAVGTAIIAVLLLGSAVVMAFTIQLAIKFRRVTMVPNGTQARLQELLEAKRYREAIDFARADNSYLGKLIGPALGEARNGYTAMERAIEEAGDAESTRILRPIEYLNVIGNIAPMLGLFGTVYGMILAFQKLVEAGGKPNPADLAGGISTALVTTFWGLIVAMPALAAYAIIRNRIDALTAEAMVTAEQLIRPFKPSGREDQRTTDDDRPRPMPRPESE